jgi:hypothetical protein
MLPTIRLSTLYAVLQLHFAASKYVLLDKNNATCSPKNAYTVSNITSVTTYSTEDFGIIGY